VGEVICVTYTTYIYFIIPVGYGTGDYWQLFSGQWSQLIFLDKTGSHTSLNPIHNSRDGHWQPYRLQKHISVKETVVCGRSWYISAPVKQCYTEHAQQIYPPKLKMLNITTVFP
jgi:hypothetical protein